jgi:poly-gamma-glutamate synthesis protein (capsule biosynthesis protein)
MNRSGGTALVAAMGFLAAACSGLVDDLAAEPGLPDEPVPPVFSYEGSVPQSAGDGVVVASAELENADLPFLELSFAGDTSFTHGLWTRDPLGDVVSLLRAPDLMIVNLETTVGEASLGRAQEKAFTFKSPPETVDLLREAGIDGVSLGNNHSLDFGRVALTRTLELLDAGGVGRAGAGENEAEAYAPMVFVRDGTSVAVLSFSRVLPGSWTAQEDRSGIASTYPLYVDRTVEAVQTAREFADVVVVMVHWGIELEPCPVRYQRDLARVWAEAGADFVIGGHPHVLQGVEQMGATWVVYSTGNFAFPSARGPSADTALFQFTIHDGTVSLQVAPVRIVAGRPRSADDPTAGRILELLSVRSFGLAFDRDGQALVDPDGGRC